MAPRGNANAYKHGLYAKRFTDDQIKDLRRMPLDDLRQEIAMLRVIIDRMLELCLQDQDIEIIAKTTNSLSIAVSTLNTTIRTHALMTGTYQPLDEALAAALDEVPFYTQTTEGELKKDVN